MFRDAGRLGNSVPHPRQNDIYKTGYALDSGNHHLLWRGILSAQSDLWFAAEPESCAHPVCGILAAQSDVWFAAEPESCAHPVLQISATILAPFEFSAVNSDGQASLAPATVEFQVGSRLWRRTWFQGILLAMAIGGA